MAAYPLPQPQTKWDAIKQGERIAAQERRRLGLGSAALPDISELLETQGVRTAQISLPDDLSGVTLVEPAVGVFVVADREHHILRRRFSYAHEYCHVLADRDQRGTVSRTSDRDSLIEVRANSFAACFLMPAEGVMQFVHGLGKGRPSRLEAEVFDEQEPVQVQGRSAPGSQDIQMYDVVQLAHHFGVSRQSALYRLRNLRLPEGVVCLISALAFHDLTTQIPHRVQLALPRGWKAPRIDHPPVEIFRFSAAAFESGVERHEQDGLRLRIYSAEKTVADCFKYRNRIGLDVAIEALRRWRERGRASVEELLRQARVCRVERVMRPYLEATL